MIWEHKVRMIIMLCPFQGPKGVRKYLTWAGRVDRVLPLERLGGEQGDEGGEPVHPEADRVQGDDEPVEDEDPGDEPAVPGGGAADCAALP